MSVNPWDAAGPLTFGERVAVQGRGRRPILACCDGEDARRAIASREELELLRVADRRAIGGQRRARRSARRRDLEALSTSLLSIGLRVILCASAGVSEAVRRVAGFDG
jgi:hypothetical protein